MDAHGRVVAWLEPFGPPPDGLLQQRRPQLQQPFGALLEHTQVRLAVGNVERHDPRFAIVGMFEPFGGVDEPGFADTAGRSRSPSRR